MDNDETRSSNIARPISRIPTLWQTKIPAIPRSQTVARLPTTSRESDNITSKSKSTTRQSFGYTGHGSKTLTAVRSIPALNLPKQHEQRVESTLENTINSPSKQDNGSSNEITAKPEKRRPRPSLSERTIESLAQVSPAPSPARRRSSTIKSNGSMGPPPRPASAMRMSRPQTPSTPSRYSPSPQRMSSNFQQTTTTSSRRSESREKAVLRVPMINNDDSATRFGKPTTSVRTRPSVEVMKKQEISKNTVKSLPKVKSMHDIRTKNLESRSLRNSPSIPTLSKAYTTPKSMLRTPTQKPRIAESFHIHTPSKQEEASNSRSAKHGSKSSTVLRKSNANPVSQLPKLETTKANSAKSSSTLRDTIAKAKAARMDQLKKSAGSDSVLSSDLPDSMPNIQLGTKSLRHKLDSAVRSGTLNLSAMSLKELPNEVLTMYDPNQGSSVSWAEAVDLKKVMLTDNHLISLPEEAFPDWTEQEMMDDEEKSNQFFGLEVLDLRGNTFSTLPLGIRKLRQLKVLNLSNNSFEASVFDAIANLNGLRELYLAKNKLKGALPKSISHLKDLQTLDLSNNEIDLLPPALSECVNLQKLNVSKNKLRSLDTSTLPTNSLVELDVSDASLSSIMVSEGYQHFPKLRNLNVAHNSLQGLGEQLLQLPALQVFDLKANRYTTGLDLSTCLSLITINASGNNLQQIPEALYDIKSLRNVDFSNNNIKSFKSDLFRLENLKSFLIAGNPLREKRYLTMDVDDMKLDFEKKNEVAIPEDTISAEQSDPLIAHGDELRPSLFCPNAGVLDLSSKNLPEISPDQVDLTKTIKTIKLANNNLIEFPIELLSHPCIQANLRSLDLSHNPKLHSTEFLQKEISLPKLQSLHIVSTGLTTLSPLTTFLQAPELKELNVSCHRLTGTVPCLKTHYPTLTTLLASDNWFDSISLEAVDGLEVLDVRNNEIESLPNKIGLLGNKASISQPGRLRSFECSGNRFKVPRLAIIEKGTEAVLRDLRRMIPLVEMPEEWSVEC